MNGPKYLAAVSSSKNEQMHLKQAYQSFILPKKMIFADNVTNILGVNACNKFEVYRFDSSVKMTHIKKR